MSTTVEERRGGLRELIHRLGYDASMVQEGFPVWAPDEIRLADIVAFTNAAPAAHDMTTAAIVGHVANGAVPLPVGLSLARELAAPTAILALDQGLELWSVGPEHHVKLRDVSYSTVGEAAASLRPQLDAAAVVAAKQADAQVTLFPMDVSGLLRRAQWSTASRLQVRVELAMTLASEAASGELSAAEDLDRASRLVIGAMAALMISDKMEPDRPKAEETVLQAARDRYPSYFDWVPTLAVHERATLAELVRELGRGVSYAGLDPAIVSYVYETALVTAASREDLGIFYTPPELAKAVLDQLPIEDLRPDRRTVIDPACGSGTLLLAAYDRLHRLAPPQLGIMARHRHASTLLRGFDADPFAVQIAGLALLLHALPQGNGWQVGTRDVIEDPAPNVRGDIVVSNPPWRHVASLGGRRTQIADRFVERMLTMLKPEGLLAAILPASWLGARTTRHARQRLQEACDIFEIWRLPEDAFPGAEMAPAVLFAQHRPQRGPYIFRRALRRENWKERFLSSERDADVLALTSPHEGLRDLTLLRGPLDDDRELLGTLPSLASILSDFGPGPVPTPPVKDRGGEGRFRWLRDSRGIPAFTDVPTARLTPVRYPDEFDNRTDSGERYNAPKVLVSAIRKADNPWRLRVLLDRSGGVIPRQSLFVVTPLSVADLPAVAAVLASAVASAWIDTLNPSRSIERALLGDLPIPASEEALEDLRRLGQELIDRAERGSLRTRDLQALDLEVFHHYQLPKKTRERLIEHFAGFTAPEGGVRYPRPKREAKTPGERGLRHYGAVMDVRGDEVKLWVPGVTSDDGDWMKLPRRFLGRHVRPGATFEVSVGSGDLAQGWFEFQPDSYLELEDFAERVH